MGRTIHLSVEEVSAEDADVTLTGDPTEIAELLEYMDISTLLQNQLIAAEEDFDVVDVEVEPHRGLRGI